MSSRNLPRNSPSSPTCLPWVAAALIAAGMGAAHANTDADAEPQARLSASGSYLRSLASVGSRVALLESPGTASPRGFLSYRLTPRIDLEASFGSSYPASWMLAGSVPLPGNGANAWAATTFRANYWFNNQLETSVGLQMQPQQPRVLRVGLRLGF